MASTAGSDTEVSSGTTGQIIVYDNIDWSYQRVTNASALSPIIINMKCSFNVSAMP